MDHNGENHVSVKTRIRTVPACAGSGRWRRHKRSPGLFRPEMHSDYLCWFHPKSSSIQTILSASEFHRVMPCGSWAIPPVGTFTLPWRFFIKLNYFNTIQQWTEPVNKSCVRKCSLNEKKLHFRLAWFLGRLLCIAVEVGLEKRRYLLFASPGAAKSWGSVKQITVHYAMDFCLRARKKTQLYRGTARLSDTAIEQKYKQNGQINV